jgi:RHS repeat-associated protein
MRRRPSPAERRRRPATRPQFEGLERRQLLHHGGSVRTQGEIPSVWFEDVLRRAAVQRHESVAQEVAAMGRAWYGQLHLAGQAHGHPRQDGGKAAHPHAKTPHHPLRAATHPAHHPHRARSHAGHATPLSFAPGTPVVPAPARGTPVAPAAGSGQVQIAATPIVTVIATTRKASEAGPVPGVFTISRTDTTSLITVSFVLSGTAPVGTDYTLSGYTTLNGNTGTVTMGAGVSAVTLTVNPLDPGDDGPNQPPSETAAITLSGGTGSSGNGGYTIGSPSGDVVTIAEVPTPRVRCGCQLPNTPQPIQMTAGSDGGDPADLAVSPAGINYADGSIDNALATPMSSAGFGGIAGQAPGWTNLTGYALGSPNGNGIVNAGLPAIQKTSNGGVMATTSSNGAIWFDPATGGGYTAKFFEPETLQPDGSGGDLVLIDSVGDQTRFYGFETTIPAAERGTFKSETDPDGNVTSVTAHAGSGQIQEIQRSATVGGVTTTESLSYTYVASGVNAGLLQNLTLRRQVNGGGWTTVRQAAYGYYDGTQSYGNPGDLMTQQVEDGSGNVLDTDYFRYYTPSDGAAFTDGLKYRFSPQSYARMAAALGNPMTATDAQVAPYADGYYQYDSLQRVTQATVQGAGSGTAGQGTYSYSYSTSTNTNGYNSWQTKAVETTPEGTTNTVYTNYVGEVMLEATTDPIDAVNPALNGKTWITYYQYDGQGRLIETAEPSAVTGYSDTYADLLHFQSGVSPYLANNAGVIDLTDYATTTTATTTTAGDVLGYQKDDKVQNGQAGTPILLDGTQYIAHTNSGITIDPVANSTVYRNTDGTGAETTSDTYTWFAGTNLAQSVAESAPVVSSTQNGPGTADVTTTYFDTYGRPIWTKDPDGYIGYTTYDNATGAVTETITDVNTALTGEFSGLPTGWTTPAGGGLNLIDQMQVDSLGRTTKETDPNGNVTYTVFLDTLHESRVYPGWNGSTGTTTGPTEVDREDRANGYFETLTMSATPATSGSAPNLVPTGGEAIGSLQTLSRDYTDNSGRTTEGDDYFSLAGVTYSTSPHIGTAGTNYYTTLYGYGWWRRVVEWGARSQTGPETYDELRPGPVGCSVKADATAGYVGPFNHPAPQPGYDSSGNPNHVQDAVGTITDTAYDNLDRPTTVSVGTNDTPGTSNMVVVRQDQYDANTVGDGNLTQTTISPDSSSGDNRVTAYAYDWRDRLVATKDGVQTTEDTTTHRPILYDDLDNLGEVTAVSQYDGDQVTLTNTKPSASLLRAYAVTKYDDQGRVYQAQQYEVNQATGGVSSTALTTNLYDDHRGDLVAESDPGGLWTKDQYDGAGRLAVESQSDGGGGATWAAANALTGDQVLGQTITTYDSNGNPILVTDKERFNTDVATDTGALGNPTTGPKARVYYTTSYYDAADRLTASVDVGTNGGSAYTRPGTVPTGSDTTLVTSYAYNSAGWVQTVTDPRGVQSKTSYDALGRTTQTIAAYNASINGGNPTASNNETANTTYDGLDHVLTVTAVMPTGTPSQTTGYVYGVTTAGGSGVNSNDLLAKLEYPDPTTGNPSTSASNQEAYQYNAVGDPTTFTDPNGTVHSYSYDVLGRQTADAATTLGTGVDGAVRRLTTAYDTGDRPYLDTSYNAAVGGSIVNQVQDAYNGFGQLTGEYQEHTGAVNTTTSPEAQYADTEMAGGVNNSRPTSMTYPNGRKIDFVYNTGLDSGISRISAIADDNNGNPGTTLEGYSDLGLDTIVQRAHPEPNINLSDIQQTGESNLITDGGDQYTGLDRFGRVVDQNWWNPTSQTSTDRFQYGYDRVGEALYKNNLVNSAQSELYRANSTQSGDSNTAYDPLGRQVAFARGTLSSSGHNGTQLDTIATASRSQSWSLDALGNWSSVTTNGTATTRTFNAQDQTATVSGGTAPTYDHDGNTTGDSGLTYVYDAWNRLVAAKNGGTTVAAYAYDALGRRVSETYSGTSTTNHLYYSSAWQDIEERQNGTGSTNVSQQYVWGLGGVDSLVLRDSYSGGVRTQRLYAQQDANGNVTALINTSGAVQERYLYDPYGSVTVTDANYVQRSGNQSSFGWQYLFQGGRLDGVTGWYAFRNRDLIPSEGRWSQRDPLGLGAGDPNIYRFVGNDPTGLNDPSGLDWYDWIPGVNVVVGYFHKNRIRSRESARGAVLDAGIAAMQDDLMAQGLLDQPTGDIQEGSVPENSTLNHFANKPGGLAAGGRRVGGDYDEATQKAVDAITGELPAAVERSVADGVARGNPVIGAAQRVANLIEEGNDPEKALEIARAMQASQEASKLRTTDASGPNPCTPSLKTQPLTEGQLRVAKYGSQWQKANLKEAITRHAGPNPTSWRSKSGKMIYENPATGRQVVVDDAGYFRIFQPKSFGSQDGKYLNLRGEVPSPARRVKGGAIKNVPLSGDDLNRETHYLIE